uniref:PSI-F n=1 Tax=Craspedostauros australis TaxID=1486917 RepID=A0A7R9WMS3_9STRA
MKSTIAFCILACLPTIALAFTATTIASSLTRSSSSLNMAPRYDKKAERWSPSSDDESAAAGYDIWGSLLRQGPQPFFQRLVKPDDYDQAVLKFMAGDKVDRNTAQAEMDAYLRNPNDWAYTRMGGYKVDYLTINKKQVALTVVWSALILTLGARGVYCAQTGENFWAILGLTSKVAECVDYNACVFDVTD